MPKLGDVSRCDALGLYGKERVIYEACPSCGKQRWVRVRQLGSWCNKCAAKKRAINYQGELSKRWSGGFIKQKNWYAFKLLKPSDPFYSMVSNRNRVLVHRYVMAQHLGRCLEPWEVVHHKNNNKHDNRLENLELVTHQQNMAYDRQARIIAKLVSEVQTLQNDVRLLKWHIRQLEQGNPVLSLGFEPDKCVEAIHGAPQVGDEMVQP